MMKILIVDDDIFLRDMYVLKFTEDGHEVHSADGGLEALRLFSENVESPFDLMLVDMIMPGMIGTELLKKIKDIYPNTKTKSIVLSNQGQDQDIDDATEAGAIGYIIKAQSIPSEVVSKVNALMSKFK